MYINNIIWNSKFNIISENIGEMLEQKVERITLNKEPIKDGAPIIFTERKDGIIPAYNIRTDRWEVAISAMDKVSKSKIAKNENWKTADKDGNPEPIVRPDDSKIVMN